MTDNESPGWASVAIHAGPIRLTGHQSVMAGHHIAMGYRVSINIQPETAAQWIQVLTEIAEGNTSK